MTTPSACFGERALRGAVEQALRAADGDEAEALVLGRTLALTRFANNAIHQNVAEASADLRVRVVVGKRVAAVWTNRLDGDGVEGAKVINSVLRSAALPNHGRRIVRPP